jgi:hypothetical protein
MNSINPIGEFIIDDPYLIYKKPPFDLFKDNIEFIDEIHILEEIGNESIELTSNYKDTVRFMIRMRNKSIPADFYLTFYERKYGPFNTMTVQNLPDMTYAELSVGLDVGKYKSYQTQQLGLNNWYMEELLYLEDKFGISIIEKIKTVE